MTILRAQVVRCLLLRAKTSALKTWPLNVTKGLGHPIAVALGRHLLDAPAGPVLWMLPKLAAPFKLASGSVQFPSLARLSLQ